MAEQNNNPKEVKQSKRSKYEPDLQPIEDTLTQLGYSPQVIQNYFGLSQKDMHLAEIYRVAAIDIQNLPNRQEFVNPLQTQIDRKGRIWVDIMLEKKRGVSLAELRKLMKVHGKPGRGRFISGRVQAANLPQLIEKTVKLQTARPLFSTLNESVAAIKADKATLSQLALPSEPDGHGIIVGIIDIEGCDFYHPNFIKNDSSRLLYLWDQNGNRGPRKPKPANYDYGVEYSQARINEALALARVPSNDTPAKKEEAVYADLQYRPIDMAHGTHVMDIAAGSSSMYPGVAPGADLIYVHFGKPTNPREEELKNMGSSKRLLDAVQYIFEKAKDTPVVINVSVAGNGGSHDGTSIVESAFDELLKKRGRAIVIAAGNTFRENLHTSGIVKTNSAPYEIQWEIQDKKNREWDMRQELEIWYDRNSKLKVEVVDPKNKSYGECPLGSIVSTLSANHPIPSVLIRHDRPDPEPGENENHISVFIANDDPSIETGAWKIRLSIDPSLPGNNANVPFHAWIESYATSHSEFIIKPNQPEQEYTLYTLNTLGNGERPIVVGSCNPRSFVTSDFSSAGPSRNKRISTKPDVCAPGEGILAARATDRGGIPMDGTSQAAPHVTGLIALMFQVAKQRQNFPKILNIQEIRRILLDTVDPKPVPGGPIKHDPQSGFGRVNALDALSKILRS